MAVYLYEAKNIKGSIEKGKVEAENEEAVAIYLRRKDCWPVSVKEEGIGGLNADINLFSNVGIKDISIFCRQLSYTLNAGISLNRALNIVGQQTENKRLKIVTTKVFEDVEKGKALADSMKKNKEYPELLVNMVEAGEASGTLDSIMTRMADYYYGEYKQWQKVKQALTYPIIVAIFSFCIVIFLAVKIIPMLISNIMTISNKSNIPLPTRISIGFSNLVTHNFMLIIALAIAFVFLIKMVKKYSIKVEPIDKLKLKLPVAGKITYKIVTSRFARTFGMLVSSGIPLIKAIDICGKIVDNKFVENSLQEAKEHIKKGSSIGNVFEEKKIFPPMLTEMIKIGEESGNLEDVLKKVAEFYDGEVETAVAQLTTLIEPLIIIVLAFVVGFIVLSVVLPIFQMYNETSNLGMILHIADSYL